MTSPMASASGVKTFDQVSMLRKRGGFLFNLFKGIAFVKLNSVSKIDFVQKSLDLFVFAITLR
jgi:hypothetical protein